MTLPRKLTVGSTFGIHPPRGGGQLRIFHLYRHLAERCPVDIVALVGTEEPPSERLRAPGLREVRVPKSARHAVAEAELQREAGIPVTDVAFPDLHELTPNFVEALGRSVATSGALVASHPYTLPALRAAGGGAPLWYDAHNVEADLKVRVLPRNATGRRLVASTRDVERACCEQAELILASCSEDGERLRELYDVPGVRLTVVPNGIDTRAIRFTGPGARRELQIRLRLPRPIGVFIGSWHEPNLRAVTRIIKLAPDLPSMVFAIVGSVGLAFRDHELPTNVELLGIVEDDFKESLLAVAALALNPVSEGSGTNMKMLEYLAAGVPVVSTEVGTRGLELDLERHVRIASIDELTSEATAVLQQSPDAVDGRLRAARRHVEDRFDWAVVVQRLLVRAGEPRALLA